MAGECVRMGVHAAGNAPPPLRTVGEYAESILLECGLVLTYVLTNACTAKLFTQRSEEHTRSRFGSQAAIARLRISLNTNRALDLVQILTFFWMNSRFENRSTYQNKRFFDILDRATWRPNDIFIGQHSYVFYAVKAKPFLTSNKEISLLISKILIETGSAWEQSRCVVYYSSELYCEKIIDKSFLSDWRWSFQ